MLHKERCRGLEASGMSIPTKQLREGVGLQRMGVGSINMGTDGIRVSIAKLGPEIDEDAGPALVCSTTPQHSFSRSHRERGPSRIGSGLCREFSRGGGGYLEMANVGRARALEGQSRGEWAANGGRGRLPPI